MLRVRDFIFLRFDTTAGSRNYNKYSHNIRKLQYYVIYTRQLVILLLVPLYTLYFCNNTEMIITGRKPEKTPSLRWLDPAVKGLNSFYLRIYRSGC